MNAVVTLTTDFGVKDGYVAAVKGAILEANPAVQLVDVTHEIPPQNVFQAAFILGTVFPYFPRTAVHLVVVDPGVGTPRRIVVLKTPAGTFVGPDNGVLSFAIRNYAGAGESPATGSLRKIKLAKDAYAVSVTNSRFFRQPVSDTFHGRDMMAPVAGLLAQGFQISAFGEATDWLHMLDLPRPECSGNGLINGHVIHIDTFGNIITDVRPEDIANVDDIRIDLSGHMVQEMRRTYADGAGLISLFGSSGYLEIALKNGSAASITGARVGDTVKIRTGT